MSAETCFVLCVVRVFFVLFVGGYVCALFRVSLVVSCFLLI